MQHSTFNRSNIIALTLASLALVGCAPSGGPNDYMSRERQKTQKHALGVCNIDNYRSIGIVDTTRALGMIFSFPNRINDICVAMKLDIARYYVGSTNDSQGLLSKRLYALAEELNVDAAQAERIVTSLDMDVKRSPNKVN